MKIDIYKSLTFKENEQRDKPYAYSKNGNRKCQHIKITDSIEVEKFMEHFDICLTEKEQLNLSVLWCLPRQEYNENDMYVCVSGFTFSSNLDDFHPQNFVISNNCYSEKDQIRAMKILEYLEGLPDDTKDVSYPV